MRYVDPDGRTSGYLNDSDSVGGAGHSAMFVETYDAKGNSSGFDLYEVGSVRKENGTWVGVGTDGNVIKGTEVLSHDSLDGSMGNAFGSVIGGSGLISGSGTCVAMASASSGSAIGQSGINSVNTESGVFVRHYDSYTEMQNAPENSRYNNVITFNTTKTQDIAIRNMALLTGKNFGKYNLFTNNCTQHASGALKAGGVNSTRFLIPNLATSFILKNNSSYIRTSWR